MAVNPLITFKAGSCEVDQSSSPYKVVPKSNPGYIYLYMEENLIHFCWRERNKTINHEDNLDLVILPTDCRFTPYKPSSAGEPNTKTNGRIFILKFSSSFQRYAFWMQSKPEVSANPSHFSERDLKIGRIVDKILQGEELNIPNEIVAIKRSNGGKQNDEDEPMEDVQGQSNFSEHHTGGNGGADSGATGGDIRNEGASAREGGADGGRARVDIQLCLYCEIYTNCSEFEDDDSNITSLQGISANHVTRAGNPSIDTASIVRNFLDSFEGLQNVEREQKRYCSTLSLHDLLPSRVTIPLIDSITPAQVDNLLSHLPLAILQNSQKLRDDSGVTATDFTETNEASAVEISSLDLDHKRSLLKRVLRTPQFYQGLSGLSVAIERGGLPNLAEALKIRVPNSGFIKGTTIPLISGDAVEALMAGIRLTIEQEENS